MPDFLQPGGGGKDWTKEVVKMFRLRERRLRQSFLRWVRLFGDAE